MRSDWRDPNWPDVWRGGASSPLSEPPGQWSPTLDVLERPDGIEFRIDVAGVPADALALTVRGDTLTVEGRKLPVCSHRSVAFHVAERSTGPFSRVLPLRLPFDAGAIRASLRDGELRIVVPRITERRGRPIRIPIETA